MWTRQPSPPAAPSGRLHCSRSADGNVSTLSTYNRHIWEPTWISSLDAADQKSPATRTEGDLVCLRRQNNLLQILKRKRPLIQSAIVKFFQREGAPLCRLIFLAQCPPLPVADEICRQLG